MLRSLRQALAGGSLVANQRTLAFVAALLIGVSPVASLQALAADCKRVDGPDSLSPVSGRKLQPIGLPPPVVLHTQKPILAQAKGSTPGTTAADNGLPSLSDLKSLEPVVPPPLPPEPDFDHAHVRSMNIGPMEESPLIQIASLRPIRLEASYNEPISLRDVLVYTLDHNLPIKVSAEVWNSQSHLYHAALSRFLPNFSMLYSLVHTHIFPQTEANTRQFSVNLFYPVFQGGRVLYGSMSQFYRARGWSYAYRGTINDTLLAVYRAYMNLLLNRALLQIRIKSVETSEAQLRLNEQLYTAGTGTRFAVMQSRTQLALDRQALLLQQVAVRQSVLALEYSMNLPYAINLVPDEDSVTEASLVDERLGINDLLGVALKFRPELRQSELFRLAAARNVQVQAASLYPTAGLFLRYNVTSTTVSGPGNGAGGSLTGTGGPSQFNTNPTGFNGLVGANITAFASPPNTVTPISPATATSNATNPTSGAGGTNTPAGPVGSPSATVPAGGSFSSSAISNTGISSISSGTGNAIPTGPSLSSATASTNPATPGVTTSSSPAGTGISSGTASVSSNSSAVSIVGGQTIGAAVSGVSPTGLAVPGQLGASMPTINSVAVFRGTFRSVAWGMQLNWLIPGFDYSVYASIQSARALARQALLQANQQLITVNQQVRSSYLNALAARKQIDVAASGVASSAEALRLANLRVQTGVGTNLELIQAQRDYITALVNQAQSIINSNLAQAQLLHDTGMISVETLTGGYNPRIGQFSKPTL